jgi:HK97 family phage major capsid protein
LKLPDGVNQMKPLVRFLRLAAADGEATEVTVGVVDPEARTVTFSFSSETPVPMWFGDEILSHTPGAVDLARINSAGPLLFNHDQDDLLGVVEKAWVGADRRGYCTIRFGKDERGSWAMGQVDDGILQNVSVRYLASEYLCNDDTETYTATQWCVYEISLVTMPADTSVGIGRAASSEEKSVLVKRSQTNPASADNPEGNEMPFKKKHVVREVAGEGSSGGGVAVVVVDPVVAENARKAEITAMCKAHNVPDAIRDSLIQLNAPIEQARGIVLNQVLARNNGLASLGGDNNPDMTEREKAKYSLIRAINAAVNERMGVSDAWKHAGFEREVSQDIGKRSGKSTAGIFMPTNLRFAMRAADYSFGTGGGLSATSGGANIVATNLLSGSFIELLRNKARVLQMGAQMLSGLTGNVDIPRQKAAGQSYWVGEGAPLSQTGGQFDKISMSPKHIGALSIITRNMLMQSSPDIEMLARADLLATIALGIDLAVLSGSGTSFQPLGIANQSGIGSIIGGTNGAALTIDHLIDMETFVASSNADENSMAYLANAKSVGTLKKLKSTTGEYLWSNSPLGQRTGTPGEINGYTVARSNQARSTLTKGTGTNLSEIFFGDWSQVLVGEWGVVEILPNPYAAGVYDAGGVELRVLQSLDVGVRHGQSFAVMSDAMTP